MRKKITKLLSIILLLTFAGGLSAVKFSGFVSDADNGEKLPHISVMIRGTQLGTYTNEEGYFIINDVPTGKIEVLFSSISFTQVIVTEMVADVFDDKFIKVELQKATVQIEGVSTTAEKHKKEINSREIVVSNVIRTTEELQAMPQFADADIFRSIQTLPGVSSMSDFSSGLYIRGGSPDQNLILLDGIDVYNPTHFGGIFSTFNTDAVENVELLKGGFPAKYGGRLSSVLNVTNLDGNRKYFEGVARVSLISASATIQGPWKGGDKKGSYMASFRRTYLELAQKALDLEMPDYYFYDGHVKLNYDINEKDKITVSSYFGKDRLQMDFGIKMLIEWGNETFSTQWVHIFNPQIYSKFILAGSHFKSLFEVEYPSGTKFSRSNDIYDGTLKSEFTYTPNDEHLLDFGFETKYNNILFLYETEEADLDPDGLPDVEMNSYVSAVYCQDSWDLGAFWTLQPGLRLTYSYSSSPNLPSSPVGKYFRVSPRISIRRKLTLASNVFFNYGRYNQFLTSLNPGSSTPMDLWFPIDGGVKPGVSDHYIAGYKTQINNDFAFDIELYFKNYENLVEYRTETDYEWSNSNGSLADVYNMGTGYSYGTDALLRTDWKGLEGFVGYGFGITKRKIDFTNVNPETNEAEEYHPRYERVHQANIVENYKLSENTGFKLLGSDVTVSATYSFGSGQPYWEIEKFYLDPEGELQNIYSYQDRIRLPEYSRTDVSIKFKWQYKSWSMEPYIQIINLLNHENIWSRDYIPEFNDDGTIDVKVVETNMFPRIPFIGFNVEF
jgi:hypothetical protein